MMSLKGAIVIFIALFSQVSRIYAQANACTAQAIAACGQYPCVQIGVEYRCVCTNTGTTEQTLVTSAAECNGGVINPVIPNQCGNAVCPAGATCVPTNQNPSQYVCVCPFNVLANPDCPSRPMSNNPCLVSNPCLNGGTCVLNPLSSQATCLCPQNTYGARCTYACRRTCDNDWCYNGGRCANAYGTAYCYCGHNYRGRRCELRYNHLNYGYIYHNPRW